MDAVLNEIKAASANIKEIEQEDLSADAGSLLQVKSEVHFEDEDKDALGYLIK